MEIAAKQLLPDRVFDNPDAAVALVNDVLSSDGYWFSILWTILKTWPASLASSHPVTTALFSLPAVMLVPTNWVSQ